MARTNSRDRSATDQASRKRGALWLIRRTIILTAGAVILVVAWLFYFAFTPLTVPETARQLQVGPGSSYHTVSRQLVANGVLRERLTDGKTTRREDGQPNEHQAFHDFPLLDRKTCALPLLWTSL